MKTNKIMKKASGMIRKTGFKLRQSSPEILIVGGIIGVIGSAVMACKATTKVSEIQDKTDKFICIHRKSCILCRLTTDTLHIGNNARYRFICRYTLHTFHLHLGMKKAPTS